MNFLKPPLEGACVSLLTGLSELGLFQQLKQIKSSLFIETVIGVFLLVEGLMMGACYATHRVQAKRNPSIKLLIFLRLAVRLRSLCSFVSHTLYMHLTFCYLLSSYH